MKEGEISKKMKEFLAAHKVVTASVEMFNVVKSNIVVLNIVMS
jgi:hypothetical protein